MRSIGAAVLLTLIAATAYGGGNQWTRIDPTPTGDPVYAFAIDPSNSHVLWMATPGRVWRSRDRGASWTGVVSLMETTKQLLIDTQNPAHVLVLTYGALYQSFDSGETWSKSDLHPFKHSMAMTRDSRTIYVGENQLCHDEKNCSGGGVTRSLDGGQTWSDAGLPEQHVRMLGADPYDANVAYAVAFDAEKNTFGRGPSSLLRTRDGGRSWRSIGPAILLEQVAFLIDPSNPSHLYLASAFGLATSFDGGDSWSVLQSGMPFNQISSLSVDARDSAALLAATPGRAARDCPAGEPAGPDPPCPPPPPGAPPILCPRFMRPPCSTYDHPRPDELLGVLRSTDGGRTWSRIIARAVPHLGIVGALFVGPGAEVYYHLAGAVLFEYEPAGPRRRGVGR